MAVKKVLMRQGKDAQDIVRWQIVKKEGWAGPALTKQGIINAFNFPFTLNPGSGCFYKCSYC